jgi:hypothetical protein
MDMDEYAKTAPIRVNMFILYHPLLIPLLRIV